MSSASGSADANNAAIATEFEVEVPEANVAELRRNVALADERLELLEPKVAAWVEVLESARAEAAEAHAKLEEAGVA